MMRRKYESYVHITFYLLLAVSPEVHSNNLEISEESDNVKNCAELRCPGTDRCVSRKFRCKTPPCPSMFYCAKSRKESLKGPPTCDSVRCTKGYICVLKFRKCRWNQICERQLGRCISLKEYYEGPATCAGFKCSTGQRCILRESFCATPPCKLFKSCSNDEEIEEWFAQCKLLRCPSEYECFLRRPADNCAQPLCKHTPDCTIMTGQVPVSEQCRGWICPRPQVCITDGITRSCNGSLHRKLSNSSESITRFSQHAARTEKDEEEEEIGSDPLPKKTLPEIERDLILQEYEKRKKMLSVTTTNEDIVQETNPDYFQSVLTTHSNKSSQVFSSNAESTLGNEAAPTLPQILKPSIGTEIPEILTPLGSPSTPDNAPLGSPLLWPDHLKLKTGIDAINAWIKSDRNRENYTQFRDWLRATRRTLGPLAYELWLGVIRASTANDEEIQEWLSTSTLHPDSSSRQSPNDHSMRNLNFQRESSESPERISAGKLKPQEDLSNRMVAPKVAVPNFQVLRQPHQPELYFELTPLWFQNLLPLLLRHNYSSQNGTENIDYALQDKLASYFYDIANRQMSRILEKINAGTNENGSNSPQSGDEDKDLYLEINNLVEFLLKNLLIPSRILLSPYENREGEFQPNRLAILDLFLDPSPDSGPTNSTASFYLHPFLNIIELPHDKSAVLPEFEDPGDFLKKITEGWAFAPLQKNGQGSSALIETADDAERKRTGLMEQTSSKDSSQFTQDSARLRDLVTRLWQDLERERKQYYDDPDVIEERSKVHQQQQFLTRDYTWNGYGETDKSTGLSTGQGQFTEGNSEIISEPYAGYEKKPTVNFRGQGQTESSPRDGKGGTENKNLMTASRPFHDAGVPSKFHSTTSVSDDALGFPYEPETGRIYEGGNLEHRLDTKIQTNKERYRETSISNGQPNQYSSNIFTTEQPTDVNHFVDDRYYDYFSQHQEDYENYENYDKTNDYYMTDTTDYRDYRSRPLVEYPNYN